MSHLSPRTWSIIIVPKASHNLLWQERMLLSLAPGQNPMSELSGLTIYNYRDHLKDLMRENCLPHHHAFYIEYVAVCSGNCSQRLRLPSPWSGVKWSRSVVSYSFDPKDCNLPCSSVHGIFQARILEWVSISFSRRSFWPRDWTQVSHIIGRRFTIWATRQVTFPMLIHRHLIFKAFIWKPWLRHFSTTLPWSPYCMVFIYFSLLWLSSFPLLGLSFVISPASPDPGKQLEAHSGLSCGGTFSMPVPYVIQVTHTRCCSVGKMNHFISLALTYTITESASGLESYF